MKTENRLSLGMKLPNYAALILGFSLSSAAFSATSVNVHFKLSPMGNFDAKTTSVLGKAKKTPDGKVSADKIEIPLRTLTTGIELRDKHMKDKYLEVDKYPNAIVTDAKGSGGKGTAMLEFHGVKNKVEGTYQVSGKEITIKFVVKIPDYKIPKVKYAGVGVKDEAEVEATIPVE
jgi:polyisoprenoid-binding protein YceI